MFDYTEAHVNPNLHKLGHTIHYYASRGTILDLRGYIDIAPDTEFGFHVSIVTATHATDWMVGNDRVIKYKKVTVGPKAWVCSNVTLFNCVIGEGCIVAIGSVVANIEIPPYTMVAGNPASIVAVYKDGWHGIKRYNFELEETK